MKEFLTILAIAFGMVLSLPAAAQLFLSICFSFFYLLLLYSGWRKKKDRVSQYLLAGHIAFYGFYLSVFEREKSLLLFCSDKECGSLCGNGGKADSKADFHENHL